MTLCIDVVGLILGEMKLIQGVLRSVNAGLSYKSQWLSIVRTFSANPDSGTFFFGCSLEQHSALKELSNQFFMEIVINGIV